MHVVVRLLGFEVRVESARVQPTTVSVPPEDIEALAFLVLKMAADWPTRT
jgi:hypothetical protein